MQRWTRIGEFALTQGLSDTEAMRGPSARAMLGLLREDSLEVQDLRRFLWELGHFDIHRMSQHEVLATLEHCLSTGMVGVLPWARMQEILFTPRSSAGRTEGDSHEGRGGSAKSPAPVRESKPASPPTPKPKPQVIIPANWADEAPDETPPVTRQTVPSSSTATLTDPVLRKLLAEKWGADKMNRAISAKRGDSKLDQLLTDDEYLSIRAYTCHLYTEINAALRNDSPQGWQSLVEHSSSGMSKMAQNGYGFTGTVTRRAKFNDAEVLSLFPQGGVFVEKGFLSTSYGGAVFPGNTEFSIASKAGVRVDSLSEYPKEGEVLFKPGSRFEVLSMAYDPVTDLCTVNMKEVS